MKTKNDLCISEVVVTLFIFIILVNAFFLVVLIILNTLFLIGVVVIWLQSAHSLMLSRLPLLLAKAILCLPHPIVVGEHGILLISLVVEDFLLFSLDLLGLELVNNLLLLEPSLGVLEVVHIQLVLQIVDIGELLDVHRVEPLELGLQALVLLLVLGLHVLNTFKSLLSSFKLLLSPGKFVQKFTLVQLELFDSIFHLRHLLSLIVNNVANALFDVYLLGVGIQVPRDGVQELQSLISRLLQVPLLAKEVVELRT